MENLFEYEPTVSEARGFVSQHDWADLVTVVHGNLFIVKDENTPGVTAGKTWEDLLIWAGY